MRKRFAAVILDCEFVDIDKFCCQILTTFVISIQLRQSICHTLAQIGTAEMHCAACKYTEMKVFLHSQCTYLKRMWHDKCTVVDHTGRASLQDFHTFYFVHPIFNLCSACHELPPTEQCLSELRPSPSHPSFRKISLSPHLRGPSLSCNTEQ